MAGGVRIGSEGSSPGEDLSALGASPAPTDPQKARVDEIMRAATWGEDLTPYLTPGFGPVGRHPSDLSAMAPQAPPVAPPMPAGWTQARDAAEAQMRVSPQRVAEAQKRLTPQPAPPQTPTVSGDARATVPRGQKTQLALYFAKAMGHQVPGEVDSPDELAFAKAAHQALLKMTKGMTVARFLQSHQSPKTRDTFSRLLDAELTKARQPQPTSGKTPTNNTPVPFAARATQGEEIPQ